jgi:O-antigen/teichoic acid export membrane protein
MDAKEYFAKDIRKIFYLLKSHIIVLLIIILSYAATYGLNLYLAKILTPQDYGDIAVVLQVLVFAVPFALLGTELSMIRYLPKYISEENHSKISGFLRWTLRIYILTSVGILLLGSVLSITLYFIAREGVSALDKYHTVVHAYWLIPLFALVMLLSQLLQALKRFYLSATFSGFAFYLFVIGSIALFFSLFESTWIGNYRAKFSILLCIGIASLIIIAFQFYSLFRLIPKPYIKVKPTYSHKVWLKSSFEMMFSTVIFAGLMAIDIFMLEILGANEAEVAHFAAIVVIASSMAVFSSAVDMLVNPIISPCIEQENRSHLQSILHIMNSFKVIPALLISLLVIIFGKNLLGHFGKDFVSAYPSLLIMLLGFFWGLCFSSAGPLLLYSGHQKLSVKISVSQLLFIIVFDCIFIPIYQIEGAVTVLTVSIILSSMIRTFFAKKYLKIHTFYFI